MDIVSDNIIHVTMYLHPIIYVDSELLDDIATVDRNYLEAAITYSFTDCKYHTDINLSRIINGPLSDYGEELEAPIKDEWEGFILDCKELIDEIGFTIIGSEHSLDSNKSEYILLFGIDDTPCGTLVYDLRISDHPFDAMFPEEFKDTALKYLKMQYVLDGTATKAGIDFRVEKVTVGSVKNDT